MEQIYEIKNSYCHYTGVYDSSRKLYHYIWKGDVNVDLVIGGFKKMMEHITSHQAKYVMHNLLDTKGTFTKANKFINEEASPHMEKHGVTHTAMAISVDPFTRFAINQFMKIMNSKIELRIFKNVEEAERWLIEKGMPQ